MGVLFVEQTVNDTVSAISNWVNSQDQGLMSVVIALLKLVLIVVVIFLLLVISKRVINTVVKRRIKNHNDAAEIARTKTVQTLAISVVRYSLYFFGIATALDAIGLGVTASSLLATAGIGGIALGLGAQSLIQDIISGAFLLVDMVFVVGDTIETAGISGTVEAINLRVTHIRGFKGELIIVPNGQIDKVVNHSKGESIATMYIEVAYDQDLNAAFASIEKAGIRAKKDNSAMISLPEISGVVNITNSIATVRVICHVEPSMHWNVEWMMQTYIQEQFIKDGIKPPYPHAVQSYKKADSDAVKEIIDGN